MMDDAERNALWRARINMPARITKEGRLFIGDDELVYPIAQGSVKVNRANKKLNALTLTLFVGDVTVEPGSKALPSYARRKIALRQWWRTSKRDIIRWYLSRIPCRLGYHTLSCRGACDPRRGHWTDRW